MQSPTPEASQRLENSQVIWFASVRPDGRPHLTPLWFAWSGGKLYVCIEAGSVKGRNLQHNERVVAALEDGVHPLICEGRAAALPAPWPQAVTEQFQSKYEWNIRSSGQYDMLVEITPLKWLSWKGE